MIASEEISVPHEGQGTSDSEASFSTSSCACGAGWGAAFGVGFTAWRAGWDCIAGWGRTAGAGVDGLAAGWTAGTDWTGEGWEGTCAARRACSWARSCLSFSASRRVSSAILPRCAARLCSSWASFFSHSSCSFPLAIWASRAAFCSSRSFRNSSCRAEISFLRWAISEAWAAVSSWRRAISSSRFMRDSIRFAASSSRTTSSRSLLRTFCRVDSNSCSRWEMDRSCCSSSFSRARAPFSRPAMESPSSASAARSCSRDWRPSSSLLVCSWRAVSCSLNSASRDLMLSSSFFNASKASKIDPSAIYGALRRGGATSALPGADG